MSNFDDFLTAQIESDPEFAAEYNRLASERAAVVAISKARRESNLTQEQLAHRAGMQPASLNRIESGRANPTIRTLSRIAEGLGKRLEIEFV